MYLVKIKKDIFLLFFIILLILLIPLGIRLYDQSLKPDNLASNTKEFTLTGSAKEGWILGEVKAYDILFFFKKNKEKTKPIIRVSMGDQVTLKLRSSDVSHGFSLKAFGIYVPKGIDPGQTVYVKFNADRTGTFLFSCTVFCGDIHHNMHGSIIVTE